MTKKILALLISVIMLVLCFAACKPTENNNISVVVNGNASSVITPDTDENTQKVADLDDDKIGEETTNVKDDSVSYISEVTTNSIADSDVKDIEDSNKVEDKAPAEDNKNTDAKENETVIQNNAVVYNNNIASATESLDIKKYKNRVQIGTYHLSMRWCDYYGTDIASREKQFREVVEEGYFNTYFLHAQDTDYLLKEIPIIIEHGGTFWLNFSDYDSTVETLEDHKAALGKIIDMITEAGYRDYLQGMFIDEPIWNGQSNRDFLDETELYYKTFGLRTFPVFALNEFSATVNGDIDAPGAKQSKIATEAMKYVTDAGFDLYTIDAGNKSGRNRYISIKNDLKTRIGHDFNYWYYPTAFEWNTEVGRADEFFCMDHLEFMAEDVLKEEYVGGIALYTYYKHKTHNTTALAQHLDVKDDNGNFIHFTEYPKWKYYSQLLRVTREKFDLLNANLVDLGV